jgi:hypothetical protein
VPVAVVREGDAVAGDRAAEPLSQEATPSRGSGDGHAAATSALPVGAPVTAFQVVPLSPPLAEPATAVVVATVTSPTSPVAVGSRPAVPPAVDERDLLFTELARGTAAAPDAPPATRGPDVARDYAVADSDWGTLLDDLSTAVALGANAGPSSLGTPTAAGRQASNAIDAIFSAGDPAAGQGLGVDIPVSSAMDRSLAPAVNETGRQSPWVLALAAVPGFASLALGREPSPDGPTPFASRKPAQRRR